MILLMFVCLAGFPFFAGVWLQKTMKRKSGSQIETYLMGVLFLFLLQGAVFEAGVWLEAPFSAMCCVFGGLCAAVLLAGVIAGGICLARRRRAEGRRSWNRYHRRDHAESGAGVWVVCAVLLFLVQAAVILYYRPAGGTADGMTAVVQTTLRTDTMYRFHPMTGQLMTLGMLPVRKLVTLPFFYGFWCRLGGLGAAQGVYGLGSLAVLLFSYLAFARLLQTVFTGTGAARKFWIGLTFLGLVWLAGGYVLSAPGALQLYYGYSGRVIVTSVLVPYAASLLYEPYISGGGKGQWTEAALKTALCFAASLFLAPPGEGILYLGLEVLCMGLLWLILEGGRRYRCRKR